MGFTKYSEMNSSTGNTNNPRRGKRKTSRVFYLSARKYFYASFKGGKALCTTGEGTARAPKGLGARRKAFLERQVRLLSPRHAGKSFSPPFHCKRRIHPEGKPNTAFQAPPGKTIGKKEEPERRYLA